MNGEFSRARAAWSMRQALLVVLGINTLQLGLYSTGLAVFDNLKSFVIFNAVDALLYIGGIYLFIRLKAKSGWAELGLTGRKLSRSMLMGILTGLVSAIIVLAVGTLIVQVLGREPQIQPVEKIAKQAVNFWQIALFIFAGSVLAPFKEELVFRGFLYPSMRDRFGVTWGIILTAAFFAMLHGDLIRFIPLLIGGIVLNLLYQQTGSLYSPVVAHGVWNGVMSLLTFWG